MVKEATANEELGVKVGGQVISMIRYADDKAVVASSEKNLQRLMDSVSRVTQEYGMKINVKKTKAMCIILFPQEKNISSMSPMGFHNSPDMIPKHFPKGAWPRSRDPLIFWALNANSSKTVKLRTSNLTYVFPGTVRT